ncbi:MAG TPA: diacylglycerol kinase family protein [Herpetosiphonaceae bacterium]|nr:diacylglycerol kinase family protein [Herpetosiphonaceae bacterium]
MKTCVILNPGAGTAGEARTLRDDARRLGEVTIRATNEAEDAIRFAREAVEQGYELVVAAGGDGTINEVVNGLSANWSQARLGIIPLGTGNDFCRTIDVSLDVHEAIETLARGESHAVDVVCVESDATRYFINVSSGGFSGLVDERLTGEMKATWGPMAYLRSALAALPDLTNYHMTIQFDDGDPRELVAYNVVLANARFVAGGVPIAPEALLDDGLVDVIIVPAASLPRLATLAPMVMLGRHLQSEDITFRRARRVAIESQPGMWFNTDGELVGNQPATFTVLPRVLQVIVGPQFDAKSA